MKVSAYVAKHIGDVMPGNVIGNLQFSGYVRTHDDVVNGAYTGKPGQFKAFDVAGFKRYAHNPIVAAALQYVGRLDCVCVVYVWRRYRGEDMTVYGVTVSRPNGEILFCRPGRFASARAVVDACNKRARLWHPRDRALYYGEDGRLTVDGFRVLRQQERIGEAWLYWSDGYTGRECEENKAGFHVRRRVGHSVAHVGRLDTLDAGREALARTVSP